MSKATKPLHHLESVSALHSLLSLKKPTHPLVSVLDLSTVATPVHEIEQALSYGFYTIALKRNFEGKVRYGQQYYDFHEGVMSFIAPQQVLHLGPDSPTQVEGVMLIVHPDFFQSYALAAKIKEYGFFSYATHEALHLSSAEEEMVLDMMKNIDKEISSPVMDAFTQDLIVAHVELLLQYCNRFYHRQFLTRRTANTDLLIKLEHLLDQHFKSQPAEMPTVQALAGQLNLSPNYLSDMLRVQTGQSTQQHIQNKMLEVAKEKLTTTNLSVSEIAYGLGFEHVQSFNRLFKGKTHQSPLEYRQSFN
jgi:AraC family transcriptional activator of pobA